jgi:hypothetical protein
MESVKYKEDIEKTGFFVNLAVSFKTGKPVQKAY